jgi:hypothetical protein
MGFVMTEVAAKQGTAYQEHIVTRKGFMSREVRKSMDSGDQCMGSGGGEGEGNRWSSLIA